MTFGNSMILPDFWRYSESGPFIGNGLASISAPDPAFVAPLEQGVIFEAHHLSDGTVRPSSMSTPFSSVFPLKKARAHEVCGESGLVFAAILAGQTTGPVVWISERWRPVINPEGLAPYCDPGRLLVTRADSQLNVLASAETALRSGAVGLVAAEITAPIGLTEGRRLQLAAETGGTTALLLIPEGGGSNAATPPCDGRVLLMTAPLSSRMVRRITRVGVHLVQVS